MQDEQGPERNPAHWVFICLYMAGPTCISIIAYLWSKGIETAGGTDISPYAFFWLTASLTLAAAGILLTTAGAEPLENQPRRIALAWRLIHARAIVHIGTTIIFIPIAAISTAA